MANEHRNPDNPDQEGTDPVIPPMGPEHLPEDPDVMPKREGEMPPADPLDDDKPISIGPVDLA